MYIVYFVETPVVYVVENASCNSSSQIHINCIAFSEFSIFGFSPWMHFFRGIFIRSIRGKNQGNVSILSISSCNYQDTGDYTCIAWNEHNGTILYTNKTVELSVNSEYTSNL